MSKCSICQERKSHLEALEKNRSYIAPRAECKRLSVDREICDDFTPIVSEIPLKVVEGIEGIWHYHLSKTGMNGHPALCGKKNVMSTELPMASWGQKSHLSETYCQECEKIYLDWDGK